MSIDPIYLLSSVIGCVVWFIRLEGRVKQGEREVELLEKFVYALHDDHKALSTKVVNDLSMVKEALARIEGKLDIHN